MDPSFSDKLQIKIEGLSELIEILTKLETAVVDIAPSLTPEIIGLSILLLSFGVGFAFTMGSRVASFLASIPSGFISLFKKDTK